MYETWLIKKSPMITGSFAENDLRLKASYGSSLFMYQTCRIKKTWLKSVLPHYTKETYTQHKRDIYPAQKRHIPDQSHRCLSHRWDMTHLWDVTRHQCTVSHLNKRATNYRALLRKMTYKDKASYDLWDMTRHQWLCHMTILPCQMTMSDPWLINVLCHITTALTHT